MSPGAETSSLTVDSTVGPFTSNSGAYMCTSLYPKNKNGRLSKCFITPLTSSFIFLDPGKYLVFILMLVYLRNKTKRAILIKTSKGKYCSDKKKKKINFVKKSYGKT